MTDMLHAYEIMNRRRINLKRFDRITWTADFPMYTCEDGKAVLYLARKENNLILKNIDEAEKQICSGGYYAPNQKDIESVIESAKSGETLRVKLSDLRLKCGDYLLINTYSYEKELKKPERQLAEWVYGQGEDFIKNMEMLEKQRQYRTAIYLTAPETVKELDKGCAMSFVPVIADNYTNAGFVCHELFQDMAKDFLAEIKYVLGKNQGGQNANIN